MKTIGDLASYSIRQDAALRICDAKRDALTSILDAVSTPPKRKLWPF